MQPASFTQRAIGRAIDMFVVFTLTLLALRPFYDETSDGDAENTAPVLFVIAVLLAVVAYEVVPVRLRGQTVGKIATRTRIVNETNDEPPGWRASLVRWVPVVAVLAIGSAISTPLTLVVIAALYLSALADPGGRTLLDKLAHTRVVRR